MTKQSRHATKPGAALHQVSQQTFEMGQQRRFEAASGMSAILRSLPNCCITATDEKSHKRTTITALRKIHGLSPIILTARARASAGMIDAALVELG